MIFNFLFYFYLQFSICVSHYFPFQYCIVGMILTIQYQFQISAKMTKMKTVTLDQVLYLNEKATLLVYCTQETTHQSNCMDKGGLNQLVDYLGIYLIFHCIPVAGCQSKNSCSRMIFQPCNCTNTQHLDNKVT